MSQLSDFQQRIHDVIPLTRAMSAELVHYDGGQLLVKAPLAPNSNHQGTGFGGAIYSVAVLAAWGLIELVVADAGLEGNVVIQSGGIDYGQPADDDFFALCQLPEEQAKAKFLTMLRRRGRARLELESAVYCGEPQLAPAQPAVATFKGRFVVRVQPDAPSGDDSGT
ncbi:thioesterase domain-containing protein, putative [Marinobacter daqiaonensis]|uniref:Thioesterase domain-containing protein, putative n=1 Tax=Marinobacter daqiaonensis TaxID=650891 RepID=A0A1I6GKM7_9GAMM|nr:thioesterase domain-containing protein [Marinobacter daqiaonensis]SFR42689.1 thioesterase domain-containing protein, putative [Marinobacter daqiaonensis]